MIILPQPIPWNQTDGYASAVVMGGTLAQIFFKPEKNLEFFRLKNCARDAYPGKLE